jgi:uncharacterized membrane protein YdbT with pleckstrin-like domain
MAQGERPLFLTRTHWIDFFGKLVLLLLVMVIGAALAALANVPAPGYPPDLDPTTRLIVTAVIILVLVVYPLFLVIIGYVRWQAQQFVITNLRVIHLNGVFSKNVLDSSLEKVNDVLMHQSFIGRMLDFGSLEILTASESAINQLRRIAHPLGLKTAMINAKQALEQHTSGQPESIPDQIANLASLRDRGVISEQEFQDSKARLLGQIGR